MSVDNSAWIDDQFASIDTRLTKEDLEGAVAGSASVDELDKLDDDAVSKLFNQVRQEKAKGPVVSFVDPMTQQEHDVEVGLAERPAPVAVVPEPEPESEYPKTIELQDGASIIFEQTRKGLRATLDSGTGANPESFYGRTETELLQRIAVGKVNATRKIHQMAKAERLGTNAPEVDPNPPARVTASGRALTDAEQSEIRELYKTDPVAANERWYQLRHGMTPEQTAQSAQAGSTAQIELYLESVGKSFKIARPTYIPDDENLFTLVAAMFKDFFKQTIRQEQVEEACIILAQNGYWTVKNLIIYFDGLSEAGLLRVEQDEEDDTETEEEIETPPALVVQAPKPAPAAARPAERPERIVRPRPGSNASYGIRTTSTTAAPPDNPSGPSDADLNDLSDDEIAQLFAGVRQAKLRGRR